MGRFPNRGEASRPSGPARLVLADTERGEAEAEPTVRPMGHPAQGARPVTPPRAPREPGNVTLETQEPVPLTVTMRVPVTAGEPVPRLCRICGMVHPIPGACA